MPPSRAGSRPRGPLDEPGISHQDEDDLLVAEVLAQVTARFGPVDQLGQGVEGLRAQPLQPGHAGDRGGQQIGDRPVGGLHLAQEHQVAGEGRPRVRFGQGPRGGVDDLLHRAQEDGGDQVAAGRETAIEGRVADARAARDLVQRCVEATLGEDGQGGVHKLAAVTFGVRAQGLGYHESQASVSEGNVTMTPA
jgi:hypothetical protein